MNDLGYEASLKAHYAEVQARLYGRNAAARVKLHPDVRSLPAPVAPVDELDEPREVQGPPHLVNDPTHARLPPVPLWRRIVREVCQQRHVTFPQIIGDSRTRHIVAARHEACYRLSHETTMSYSEIGRRLGGRDHTTIIHGTQMHEKRMAEKRQTETV